MPIINQIRFTPIRLPLAKPLILRKLLLNGEVVSKNFEFFIVWVCELFAGNYYGQGYTYTIPLEEGKEIYTDIKNQCYPGLIGQDINKIEQLTRKLSNNISNKKTRFYSYFLSAIDIAGWDIKLQLKKQSLANYFGSNKKTAFVYGSCGWLSYSLDQLVANCQYFLNKNIMTYKLQIGSNNDEQRLKILRDTLGDRVTLLADANQGLSYDQAVITSKILEKYNVGWFEEPIAKDSDNNLVKLAENTQINLATGENRLTLNAFESLILRSSVKYIQPDIVRCGGVTTIAQIGKLCSENKRCLAMHLNHEYAVSISPAFSDYQIEYAEFFPENSHYFTHDFTAHNGVVNIPQVPGTGVRFTQDVINHYKLEKQ